MTVAFEAAAEPRVERGDPVERQENRVLERGNVAWPFGVTVGEELDRVFVGHPADRSRFYSSMQIFPTTEGAV